MTFKFFRRFSARRRAIRRADRARDRGAPTIAAALYGAVLDRWGRDQFGVLVQLGNACKDSGDLAVAARIYAEAGAMRPDDADVHVQRGHLAKLEGDMVEAARQFARALELDGTLNAARHELDRLQPSFVARTGSGDLPFFTARPGLARQAAVIRHRLVREYRWRRA